MGFMTSKSPENMNFRTESSYFLEIMTYPLFPLNCYILNWQAKNSKHNQNKSIFMHHYVAHK